MSPTPEARRRGGTRGGTRPASGLSAMLCAAVVLALCGPAWAWLARGHDLAARAAVMASAQDMPPFFAAGLGQIAHNSLEPDAWTRPIAPDTLHYGETSEHFFDQEMLKGLTPPPRRDEYIRLCAASGIDPTRVGFLPYAVTEWTGRLSVALAEHRRWPANPYIQAKTLVYAGILAHYAADLNQPLHVTIHWDGQAGEDGKSPRTGIHLKVDALAAKLRAMEVPGGDECPVAFDSVWDGVMTHVTKSHSLVDVVYEMEPQLPAKDEPLVEGSPADQFARERLTESARFIASLYLTAWRDSEAICQKLPDWHIREREELDRERIYIDVMSRYGPKPDGQTGANAASQPASQPCQPASAPASDEPAPRVLRATGRAVVAPSGGTAPAPAEPATR